MPESRPVFVLPGLRSPFCKMDRELGGLDALRLSVPVVQQSVVGAGGPGPGRSREVDLVVWGTVIPSLTVSNWAREVWLDAGLDPHVPALTVVQQCGTSLAAATQAAAQIRTGGVDLALCGGVESMSSVPIGLSRNLGRAMRQAAAAGSVSGAFASLRRVRLRDVRLTIPAVKERTTGKSMGQHAEDTAKVWDIGRTEQDELALASHRRAVAAAERGFFRGLLAAPGTFPIDADTLPRSDTTPEGLARLKPVFDRAGGTLTAGNSSPLTDGAAAVWVASEKGAGRLAGGLPRVRLVDWELAGAIPEDEGLLMAPAIAVPRLLARHGLSYADIAIWEVHEAFAAQVLATIAALESRDWLRDRAGVEADLGRFPGDRMNPNGGSIALGHPFGATGARLLSQAAVELAAKSPGTRAIVSVCAAGGLGHVALLEAG